jgi:hypothetical protein
MIPTPAPAMDKSAPWCGVRRSENKGLARTNRVPTSDLPPAKGCRRLTLLCRLTWADGRKPAYLFTGQPQCAAAPRPPGWRERSNSSRECVIASIKRHRVVVFFVLAYAQTWGPAAEIMGGTGGGRPDMLRRRDVVARLFSPPDPVARGCGLVRRCVACSGGRLGDRRVRECPARGGATHAGPACGLVVDLLRRVHHRPGPARGSCRPER